MDEPRVTLFIRHGCHLCVDTGLLLDDMIGADGYALVDIETDDDLLIRYASRIPVIALDGADRLEAPISGPDLARLLAEADLL